MKRILLIILCLFCLIGCKPVVEPEVVKLNEQEAMEYVKDFYSNADVIQWVGPMVKDLHNLKIMFAYDTNTFKTFMEAEEFDKVDGNMFGFLIESVQARVDELFGKRFNVKEIFKKNIDGDYIMFEYSEPIVHYPVITEETFSIKEVTDKYVIIEKLSKYIETYDGYDYELGLIDLVVVYPTEDGLKIWDFVTGFGNDELIVTYLPE